MKNRCNILMDLLDDADEYFYLAMIDLFIIESNKSCV